MQEANTRNGLSYVTGKYDAFLAFLYDCGGRPIRDAHSVGDYDQDIFRCLRAFGVIDVRSNGNQASGDDYVSKERVVQEGFCRVFGSCPIGRPREALVTVCKEYAAGACLQDDAGNAKCELCLRSYHLSL